MGFLKQDTPVVDYAEWSTGTRAEKIVPMYEHCYNTVMGNGSQDVG